MPESRMVGASFEITTGYFAVGGSRCYSGQGVELGSVHTGWDCVGPLYGNANVGTRVVAVADGLVVFSGFLKGWGNMVVVYHPQFKVWTRYAHLTALEVKVGQRLSCTQRLGGMGKGPNGAYACHLHFDVFQVKPPTWGFWNGGAKSSAARAVQVKRYFMPPRAFFQKYGLTNVLHKGGCNL